MFPPERIVWLTEKTVETLYLLGEQDCIVGNPDLLTALQYGGYPGGRDRCAILGHGCHRLVRKQLREGLCSPIAAHIPDGLRLPPFGPVATKHQPCNTGVRLPLGRG